MKNKNLITLLLSSVFFIVICYLYVDKQIVWFLYEHNSRQYTILKFFSDYVVNIINFLIFFFYIYYSIELVSKRVSDFDSRFILVVNAVLIGQLLKKFSKVSVADIGLIHLEIIILLLYMIMLMGLIGLNLMVILGHFHQDMRHLYSHL